MDALASEEQASNDRRLEIELNTLAERANACRFSFLISNQTGNAVDELSFEFVLFNTKQQIMTLVAAKAGALPVGKSRVKQFDIAGRQCTSVSRLLLNDITECKGGPLTPKACLELLKLKSRTEVPLIY